MPITAKVVADSIANGIRITTLELTLPKFIDAEFEKHRMLSSNSSSTRAVPLERADTSYLPLDVRRAAKGMQGELQVTDETYRRFQTASAMLRDKALGACIALQDEVHKQHIGRWLEPWTVQRKLVTATEWSNFFKLRLAADAQPDMQQLARAMYCVMGDSTPVPLQPGYWHLPYLSNLREAMPLYERRLISAARCARVSYAVQGDNITADLKLAARLLESGHMTPFEHQATPMLETTGVSIVASGTQPGVSHLDRRGQYWSGNFRGWIQYRKVVELRRERM